MILIQIEHEEALKVKYVIEDSLSELPEVCEVCEFRRENYCDGLPLCLLK